MIKFRAWDKRSGIYLYDVQNASDMFSDVKYENGENADCDEYCFAGFLYDERYDVEQFTGLKDASGDEIYENDLVLLDPDDPPYQVIFDEGKFELSNDYLRLVYDLSEEFMDCEIIGNVHKNPELLEDNE
ncbi:YopX family protein [Lactiplantibacillus plantarum]|uniref:YopX family protein n=1 Tax=Lactiplantibacillus plantarum TaxID=1590 RepID=UPI0005EE8911|nr:YopX family protein [Lactiplantibacillus plantarum]